MSNLTERLREVRHLVSIPLDDGPTTADLCHEAADRIEELEAALKTKNNRLKKQADRIGELEVAVRHAIEDTLGLSRDTLT